MRRCDKRLNSLIGRSSESTWTTSAKRESAAGSSKSGPIRTRVVEMSVCGGKHWVILASLIETCKLNSVDPQAYIADVFARLVAGHPVNRLDDLLNGGTPGRAARVIRPCRRIRPKRKRPGNRGAPNSTGRRLRQRPGSARPPAACWNSRSGSPEASSPPESRARGRRAGARSRALHP